MSGPCTFERCEKPADRYRGLCNAHYMRQHRGADMGAPMRIVRPGVACERDDCIRPHYAHGLCEAHAKQRRRAENPSAPPASLDRDADGHKRCKKCSRWLEVDRFTAHGQTADRLHAKCRDCRSEESRSWHLAKNYRMTLEDEADLRRKQGGCCAVCRRAFDLTTAVPHVDHDHSCCPATPTCGKCVRGLLCSRCNQGLGLFADSVEALVSAIAYLKGNT